MVQAKISHRHPTSNHNQIPQPDEKQQNILHDEKHHHQQNPKLLKHRNGRLVSSSSLTSTSSSVPSTCCLRLPSMLFLMLSLGIVLVTGGLIHSEHVQSAVWKLYADEAASFQSSSSSSSPENDDDDVEARDAPNHRPLHSSPLPPPSRNGMVPRQQLRIPHDQDIHIDPQARDSDLLLTTTTTTQRQLPKPKNDKKRLPPPINTKPYASHHPRIVMLLFQPTKEYLYQHVQGMTQEFHDTTIKRQQRPQRTVPSMENATRTVVITGETYLRDFEKPFWNECDPKIIATAHPTCNDLHGVSSWNYDDENRVSLLANSGSWRSVWDFNDTSVVMKETQERQRIVLKLLHWSREFEKAAYNLHATDALAMDLLTASPYIVNAYGYCGQSVMTEFASSGARETLKSNQLRDLDRLRIARDLARGLADLQSLRHLHNYSIPYDNNGESTDNADGWWDPMFAHNDINIANTIASPTGQIKWNDFNIGVFLRYRRENSTTDDDNKKQANGERTQHRQDCGGPVRFAADMWRSPEEIRNVSYVALDKSDMYMLGNILYQVMIRHQPWTHKEPVPLNKTQVAAKKLLGELPTFPERYANATKPELRALMAATVSCYHPDPAKRLNALELAHALSVVYAYRKQGKGIPHNLLRELFYR